MRDSLRGRYEDDRIAQSCKWLQGFLSMILFQKGESD
jgi:hypothetical protein